MYSEIFGLSEQETKRLYLLWQALSRIDITKSDPLSTLMFPQVVVVYHITRYHVET